MVDDFFEFKVDDIFTLSDIQTQKEFGKTDIDFKISEVRVYKFPNLNIKYSGYISKYKSQLDLDEKTIMFLIRKIGDITDFRILYLDMEGAPEELEPVFNNEQNDLIDRFEVDLHFNDCNIPVTWDKQGITNFGVKSASTQSCEVVTKTIAEYFTNDDTRGNSYCFVEWIGDKDQGYIEIWYGHEIRENDVEMFKTK